jgi:adenine-specific DNA-methyltransferase
MTKISNNNNLGYSPDVLAQRKAELLTLLSQAAPEVLSDNQQINVNKLKDLLGEDQITGNEYYELSWAGKAAARREIQKTSSHTLMPDATNPPNAQHVLIKGENLEVLRALQKSYYGKVKMIYIDPPYNTGNDSFVYPDDYSETLDEYQKRTGEKNEAGYLNKQSLWKKNSKESGQYHSAWLSMMYPRLYLARNLLSDDGVIFISIDDNEQSNLKLICDEIFGESNFVANIIWLNKEGGGSSDSLHFKIKHEYILCYAMNKPLLKIDGVPIEDEDRYTLSDEHEATRGKYQLIKLDSASLGYVASLDYPIKGPNGSLINPNKDAKKISRWRWSQEKFEWGCKNDFVIIKKDRNEDWAVYTKQYLNCDSDGNIVPRKNRPFAVIEKYSSTTSSNDLSKLFGAKKVFNFSKPYALIKYLASLICMKKNEIILDFFAGSGTTAQAVMELNFEDNGNRQCICVQMPEPLDEDSENYKSGYKTIADITRARISKVIDKLKVEYPDKAADLACAYFTLAPSNFKVWRGDVNDTNALRDQMALFQNTEKIGEFTRPVDAQITMLSELLLKHGLGALGVHAISEPKKIAGITVHRVLMPDDRRLWLCFEPYAEALKDEIINARPAQVIMLNSCFVGDKADELLSNLQLELSGLDISLTII